MNVTKSVSIDVYADNVWGTLKDFGGVQKWIRGIRRCSTTSTASGITRTMLKDDGTTDIESLETINEDLRKLAFRVLQDNTSVNEYLVTISIIPRDDACEVSWISEYDAESEVDDISAIMNNRADLILTSLKRHCELDSTQTPLKKLKPE